MRSLLFTLLILVNYLLNAQAMESSSLTTQQDSLLTNTINKTLKLSAKFSSTDIDSALFYAEKAIKLSKKADEKILTKSLMHKGVFLTLKGKYAGAQLY